MQHLEQLVPDLAAVVVEILARPELWAVAVLPVLLLLLIQTHTQRQQLAVV